MEQMAVAAITGVVTLTVCLINNHYQNSSTRNLLEYRLKKLEEKVDKHNGVIERTYKLEQDNAVIAEQIKVANHRIEDLEKEKSE